jgi:hypothetical protein
LPGGAETQRQTEAERKCENAGASAHAILPCCVDAARRGTASGYLRRRRAGASRTDAAARSLVSAGSLRALTKSAFSWRSAAPGRRAAGYQRIRDEIQALEAKAKTQRFRKLIATQLFAYHIG